MYKNLLSPGKIGNLELKNRVVMTAMGVGVAIPGRILGATREGFRATIEM